MIYSKSKREKHGKCNICPNEEKLTYDHVPPKNSTVIKVVEQETIFAKLTQKERKINISQNGVKFRTLCSVCNNHRLGIELDPVLNDFSQSIFMFLKSNLFLPKYIEIETRPAALVRAVIGHILAAKIEIDNSEDENLMRRFFLNHIETIPNEINIFYWIYPYEHTVVIRDIAMPSVRGKYKDIGIFSVLKYFPMAFLVTNLTEYNNLPSLTYHRTIGFEEKRKITINLQHVMPLDWPENVAINNFIIGGASLSSSVFATPRKKS